MNSEVSLNTSSNSNWGLRLELNRFTLSFLITTATTIRITLVLIRASGGLRAGAHDNNGSSDYSSSCRIALATAKKMSPLNLFLRTDGWFFLFLLLFLRFLSVSKGLSRYGNVVIKPESCHLVQMGSVFPRGLQRRSEASSFLL